jgi:HAE1 family hydrophobic/amphiphilic exporter-1
VNVVRFSIDRPVTIGMIFIAVVVFGFVSLGRLDVRLLPEISYPTLTVQTEYEDAAPLEVESFVTRPLEESVGVIPGLRRLSSVSKPGMSEITLEFAWNTAMDYAALDVREKVDLVELPRECKEPVILRYDPSLDPVVRLGVYGDENLVRLRYLADKNVKKELESLDGVASAKVLGGLEEEIQVELDEQRLATLGIPISTVSARLFQDNINQSGGRLRDAGAEFLLRTENEFADVDEIRDTIVSRVGGKNIVLADLGSVTRGYREREVITRINGREAVEVAVHKEGDANTVEVARRVRGRVKTLEKDLPESVKLDILFDQSRFIQTSINEVLSNAILGAILAIGVLYLFLRDVRSTVIIGLSIPISILATFVLMRQLGVSLNLMSLGGLALGVGMLVDNSIVVLESISRYKDKGAGRREATYEGATTVGRAVSASTLTTVAVFLPIVFVEGIAGQVFRDQALTVSVSLLASLVVALMLIPMVSSLEARRGAVTPAVFEDAAAPPRSRKWPVRVLARAWRVVSEIVPVAAIRFFRKVSLWVRRGIVFAVDPVTNAFAAGYARFERRYRASLDGVMARRGRFLGGTLVLFFVAIAASRFIGAELIPQFSQGEFSFNIQLPEGSTLEATDARLSDMEKVVERTDGVERCFTTVGQASRVGSNAKSKDKNIGQLNVVLEDKGNRKNEERIIEQLRGEFSRIEGMTFKFARPAYFTLQTPVEVEIYGYNLDDLQTVASRVESELAAVPGVTDVRTSMELGNPEVNVVFDRERLSSFDLSLNEVSNSLKTKIQGEVPTRFKERENQVDIRVRTSAWQAQHIDEVKSLVVGERNGTRISLSTVADVTVSRGLSRITRISQQRAAVVSGNLVGRDLASVSKDIRGIMDAEPLPPGVTIDVGGQNQELSRSFRSLVFALSLAVFLVYLVMAAQFESLIHPFVILFTVPMGAIGVIFTLLVFGQTVSVVVFVGVIMLAGIVVNNAIVLIDYINQLRAEGMDKFEAIREAAAVRLRPIVMTTLTTVLGLLPMALGLGEGAEIRAPMALTVIGGLIGSTVLTLFIIPALYSVFQRGR